MATKPNLAPVQAGGLNARTATHSEVLNTTPSKWRWCQIDKYTNRFKLHGTHEVLRVTWSEDTHVNYGARTYRSINIPLFRKQDVVTLAPKTLVDPALSIYLRDLIMMSGNTFLHELAGFAYAHDSVGGNDVPVSDVIASIQTVDGVKVIHLKWGNELVQLVVDYYNPNPTNKTGKNEYRGLINPRGFTIPTGPGWTNLPANWTESVYNISPF